MSLVQSGACERYTAFDQQAGAERVATNPFAMCAELLHARQHVVNVTVDGEVIDQRERGAMAFEPATLGDAGEVAAGAVELAGEAADVHDRANLASEPMRVGISAIDRQSKWTAGEARRCQAERRGAARIGDRDDGDPAIDEQLRPSDGAVAVAAARAKALGTMRQVAYGNVFGNRCGLRKFESASSG